LGFKIVGKPFLGRITCKSFKEKELQLKTRHDERCPKCKETVRKLLEKIYGKVEPNFNFEIGTYPEDFRNRACYENL